MPDIRPALDAMAESGIPLSGACRFSTGLILPGVRSAARLPAAPKTALIGLFPYYAGGPRGGNLPLYSRIPDYHAVAGEMLGSACQRLSALFPGEQFVPFVDASPIDEVAAALRAGLGVRGRNGQLITGEYGSLVFIGEIVTGLDFGAPSLPEADCEGCGRCIAACPTGALSGGGFDKSKCRSWFSQKKGELTVWERRQLQEGGLAWGCDICTLACPRNRSPKITPIARFSEDVEPTLTEQNLERLMQNRAFAWRGEKVLRRNLALLKNPESGPAE